MGARRVTLGPFPKWHGLTSLGVEGVQLGKHVAGKLPRAVRAGGDLAMTSRWSNEHKAAAYFNARRLFRKVTTLFHTPTPSHCFPKQLETVRANMNGRNTPTNLTSVNSACFRPTDEMGAPKAGLMSGSLHS